MARIVLANGHPIFVRKQPDRLYLIASASLWRGSLLSIFLQLLTIPLAVGGRDRFIGVVDGMASVVPFGVSLVVIFGKPELLGTPTRWGAAFLLAAIAAVDLFGGYMLNIALSRRTMEVASPAM